MSTHGCFVTPFPPSYTRMLRPDDGLQEPDDTADDDSYYTGGAYYYVLPAGSTKVVNKGGKGKEPEPSAS